MSFENLKGNEKAKKLLINELKKKKSSGTYLFYGVKGTNLLEFALSFAKAINCKELENDFCGKCRTCLNIDKMIYSDMNLFDLEKENLKIDSVREIIMQANSSAYENGKKIFIIKGVNLLRKEAANALLKTIEEPLDNTYFILLSNDLNILPTIASRSMLVKLEPLNIEELGVNKNIFNFFEGNIEDILNIKKHEYDFSKIVEYKELIEKISFYLEERDIRIKADIIKAIEEYNVKKKFLDKLEKIQFAEEIEQVIKKDRYFLKELLYLFILKDRKSEKLERLIEIKESLKSNTNISLVLYNFFLYY